MKLLFIGDVVGENGCRFLMERLPGIRREPRFSAAHGSAYL